MRTLEFEFLDMRFLNMIIHRVLFGTYLWAMGALEFTGFKTNVLEGGGHVGRMKWKGRKMEYEGIMGQQTYRGGATLVSIF